MSDINIIQAFQDPKIFGFLTRDQKTWANWKVTLKSIFGLLMSREELKVYHKYTDRKKPSQKPLSVIQLNLAHGRGLYF